MSMQTMSGWSSGLSKRRQTRFSGQVLAMASLGVVGLVGTARAANTVYTYTGPGGTSISPVTGDWNTTTNWAGSVIPVSGTATTSVTELDFNGSGGVPYISTNDIGTTTFYLTEIQLNSSDTVTESLAASNASQNTLSFVDNGTTTPTILQNGVGAFNIGTGIVLANNLAVGGSGSGAVSFNGPISGTGALSLNNLNGIVNFAGANSLTGTTAVNFGIANFTGTSTSTGNANLQVGAVASDRGQLFFNSSSTAFAYNALNVGVNANGYGAVTQNSGTVTISVGTGYGELGQGSASAYGSYTLSGGTLAISPTSQGGFRIGDTGMGVFTQTGGTFTVTRYLAIADNAGATGVFNALGGVTSVGGGYYIIDGNNNGIGYLNLGSEAGGNAVVAVGATGVSLGNSPGSGTVNLNSGALNLSAGSISKSGGNGYVNFNGGKIQSTTTGLTLVTTGLTSGYVYNGGAAFNVSGSTISDTVSANLQAATGNGIYKSATFAPTASTSLGSGYIGAPIVTITDSTTPAATGAQAIANISNGAIVGFTMTNPGQGYLAGDVLSFALAGGGALTPASGLAYTLGSGDIAANAGGLTKYGTGTLVMTGTDTYTGATNVSAGILDINNTASMPSLAVNLVASGATLMLDLGATSGTVAAFTSANLDTIRADTTFAAGSYLGLNTISGNFVYNSNISGVLGLMKTGGNVLSLGGSNSYTGGILIPAGAALGTINAATVSAFGASGSTLSLNAPSTIELSTDIPFGGTNPVYNVSIGLASTTNANVNTNFVLNRATGSVTTPITHNFGLLTISENGGQATKFNVSAGATTPGGVVDTLAFSGLSYGNSNAVTETLYPVGANLTFGTVTPVSNIGSSQIATLDLDGTSTGNAITGTISNSTFSGFTNTAAITKTNTGTWTLSGASTYTGTTNISAGTLVMTSGASLGNTAMSVLSGGTFKPLAGSGTITIGSGAGSLTVVAGGNLNMSDGSIGTLKVVNTPGTTALTLGTASASIVDNLSFDLGATAGQIDAINITGNASVLSSTAISIVPLAGDASLTPGNYTFITAGAGLNASGFTLATSSLVLGPTTYAFSLASSSSTAEVLTIFQLTGSLPSAFWDGNIDNNWETNNGGSTNWATNVTGGTDTGLVPDETTNVTFTVSSGGANLGTVLSSNQSINSLTFNGDASGAVNISGYTLTIGGLGVNGNAVGTGITLSGGSSPVNLMSNVILFSNQTWTNNSGNPFNVSGSIGGLASLAQAGSGLIILSGSNSFSGGYTLGGGTLDINNASALGVGAFTISNSTSFDNTTGAPLTLTTNNAQAWNADFTFTGSSSLNMGSGSVTLGGNRIVTIAANTLSVGGIGDAGLGYSLTKTGPGTLNMLGNNTYGGNTIVTGGTVNYVAASGNSSSGGLDVAQVAGQVGVVNINTGGAVSFTGNITVADANDAIGAINIINGTVNIPNAGSINYVTPGNGGYGALTLSGGSLTVGSPTFSSGIRVGGGSASGVGVLTQTAGNLTSYRYLAIGNAGAVGLATFTAGTTTVVGLQTIVGDSATLSAVMNLGTQAGGTDYFTTGGTGMIVNGAGATATLNLNAGTLNLSAGSINQTTGVGGSATLNLNGAVVTAGVSGLTLINNTLNSVNVYNGGANFNVPTGLTATVSANLLATTGNGIYAGGSGGSFAVTGNGSVGYVGAPVVYSISGGSGSGAMGIATLTNGVITGVTMTNPGQGYQVGDNLTFSFSDGGYNNTATSFNYTLTAADIAANNGGLTKTGAGLLTLSGSSTYTGNTLLKSGSIFVATPTALGTGSAVLSNGTTLALATIAGSTPINLHNGFTGFTTNGNGNYTSVISGGGTSVMLTNGGAHEATSSFSPTPISISDTAGFTVSFTYNHTVIGGYEVAADGVAFTFQNQSSGALGGSGGSFGYSLGGTAPDTLGVPISPSVASVIDVYHDEIGFGQNGVVDGLTGIETDLGISNQSSSTVTIVYNGVAKTLTETISNTQATLTDTLTGFDLVTQLNESGGAAVGYIGFTGATGGVTDTQSISNFSFNTSSSTGLGISNAVVVNPAASTVLQLGASAPYATGAVGPITIGSGGLLTVSIGSAPLTGVSRGVLTTTSVSFANSSSGTLDVGPNALDITGQTLEQVTALVRSAYSNGTWTGPGITSTIAAGDHSHLTALGVIYNTVDGTSNGSALYGNGTSLGLFDGISPTNTDVLVKYTYYGDTDLSGVVDGTDYSRIDNAYSNNLTAGPAAQLTGWFNGDFNYDGVIDGSDYTLIDNAYNMQGVSLAAQVAQSTDLIASPAGASAVPEPATIGLAAMAAVGLLGRRRRRSH